MWRFRLDPERGSSLKTPKLRGDRSQGGLRATLAASTVAKSTLATSTVAMALIVGCGSSRGPAPHGPVPPLPPPTRSTSASPVVPPKPQQPAPLPEGALGDSGPVLLRAASPNGRWVALCQVREDTDGDGALSLKFGARGELLGDQLGTYLVRGAGAGERIQELLDSDVSGRWLLYQRRGRVYLFDDYSGTEVDLSALGADARDDTSRDLPHRALSFDAAGKYLAYLRLSPKPAGGPPTERLVLRELETGSERELDPGRGSVYRLRLSSDAEWLVLDVLIDDTNKNGRLDWPLPELSLSESDPGSKRCAPPVTSFAVYPGRGDQVFTRTIRLPPPKPPGNRPSVERHDQLLSPLGPRLVFRGVGGRLMLREFVHGRGKNSELVPGACNARLLHADPSRNKLVVACEPTPEEVKEKGHSRHALWLVSLGKAGATREPLGIELAPIRTDTWPGHATPRLLHFYPGSETRLLDLEQSRAHPLKVGDIVLSTHGPRALVRRRNALWLYDVTKELGAAFTELKLTVDALGEQLHRGRFSWVAPHVVDLDSGTLHGTFPHVLALSAHGRVLVPSGVAADGSGVAHGPLSWEPAATQPPKPSQ